MSGLSFRTRLTLALLVAALAPLAAFGLVLFVAGLPAQDPAALRLLLGAFVVAALLGVAIASVMAGGLLAPLRALASALDRVAAGDRSDPLVVQADDEIGRLAERQNRLAADLDRRNRQLGRILAAVSAWPPRQGGTELAARAANDARQAFGLIDATIVLGDPAATPTEERIPGDPLPVRSEVRAGADPMGLLAGHAPATASWERADQDLLDLYAGIAGVALRNADLFARVEAQNEQLIALDAAKDDFLRGVSHNLQTPLARVRAYAEQLTDERPDARLSVIAEQSDRLSRMVRQLLIVSRLDSGLIRPRADVFALAPRIRRAWDSLAAEDVAFTLEDGAAGWLAIADADHLDQVLWALLDNAAKYGAGTPVRAVVALDQVVCRLRCTIEDGGPGVTDDDRGRLFARWARGEDGASHAGSGLGLYVSRGLMRAMDGDLVLEDGAAGRGAAFTLDLPAEPPTDA